MKDLLLNVARLLVIGAVFFLAGWKMSPGKVVEVKTPVDVNRPLWEDLRKTDESIIEIHAKTLQYCYIGMAAAKDGDAEFTDVSMETIDKLDTSTDRFLFKRRDILNQLGSKETL